MTALRTISYCATAYVITAVQQDQFTLEMGYSRGMRKQDSQTLSPSVGEQALIRGTPKDNGGRFAVFERP
jgi:hypothetical protein